MKFLVIVNESPWGSCLALSAWRFVRASLDSGIEVPAVFFRGEGVYNALTAEATDAGTESLSVAWRDLETRAGVRLLLCSSSRKRRLPALPAQGLIGPDFIEPGFAGPDSMGQGFIESGLPEMFDLMLTCDRVVSF